MKSSAWSFGGVAIFIFVATIVYWFLSHEIVGTVALIMALLMCVMIWGYLLITLKSIGTPLEDDVDATIEDGAGVIGFFPEQHLAVLVLAGSRCLRARPGLRLVVEHPGCGRRPVGTVRLDLPVLRGRLQALTGTGPVLPHSAHRNSGFGAPIRLWVRRLGATPQEPGRCWPGRPGWSGPGVEQRNAQWGGRPAGGAGRHTTGPPW